MRIHSPDCFPGVPDCSCHFLHYWAVFCLVVRYLILGYYWYYRYLYGNFSPLISETVVDFFLISRFSSNRSVFLEGYFCVKFIAFLEFGFRVPHQTCVLWLHLFDQNLKFCLDWFTCCTCTLKLYPGTGIYTFCRGCQIFYSSLSLLAYTKSEYWDVVARGQLTLFFTRWILSLRICSIKYLYVTYIFYRLLRAGPNKVQL